jgi:hypothetical protein
MRCGVFDMFISMLSSIEDLGVFGLLTGPDIVAAVVT